MTPPTSRPRKRRPSSVGEALRRLPLGSLRVFLAVADHLSFTRAAASLGVTVGATSMQVQALEEYLGQPLFRRRGRLVELTAEGAQLVPRVREGLGILQRALDDARAEKGSGPLRITTLGSFLTQWLSPRIPDFENRHSGITLSIESSSGIADFTQSDLHAAIRMGFGSWSGLTAEKLMDEWLVPVCTPTLLQKLGPINDLDDLRRYRLLHSPSEPWSSWLLWSNGEEPEPIGAILDDSAAIVRAAEAGHGLALARWSLVVDEVAQGRLAVASRRVTPFSRSYYFVYPPRHRALPKLKIFHEWLKTQAAAQPKPPGVGSPGRI